jgi:hypothetical protein
MLAEDYNLKSKSYSVTPDGRCAAIQALFSQAAILTNKWASAPAVVVLEFMDGAIISEIWNYDGRIFH